MSDNMNRREAMCAIAGGALGVAAPQEAENAMPDQSSYRWEVVEPKPLLLVIQHSQGGPTEPALLDAIEERIRKKLADHPHLIVLALPAGAHLNLQPTRV